MQFSFKRVKAIFIKDWKDLQRNSYVIFTLAIPLMLAAFIGRIDEANGVFDTLPINMSLVISGAFIQAAMVAEEKEKNTLRGLLLSPANTAEIFVGKSMLSTTMTIVIIIGSIFLSNYKVLSPVLFTISILLSLVFYIAIGTILGLLSRTVMETSIVGMPVLVVFGMSSMFKSMIKNETFIRIIEYLPNEQLDTIWIGMNSGKGFSNVIGNLLVLLAWVVISVIITVVVYKKRRID